jgi:alkylation response protein AidB-like acyl-CoA dehydrogenase
MDRSLRLIQRHRQDGSLLNAEGKLSAALVHDLGRAGFWGLRIGEPYGGHAATFRSFAPYLTRLAAWEPSVAGLAYVHSCLGAVNAIGRFGSPEQRRRFLPRLARGETLAAFALTEPGAGSDLTALRTQARRHGDHYLVTGRKLFITNAIPGNTVALVCRIEDTPQVLICELPQQEGERFRLERYGLWAPSRNDNHGLVFDGHPVPAENLLVPEQGDGMTIAYDGINQGRVALCASAAGSMRRMLASMIPWIHYRVTYGQPIARRELVQRRLGRLAGLIVACDALVEWCGQLVEEGGRAELECIVAKVFGSEAQKEAATELLLKTHGGRAFLRGHLLGDHIHDFLAPCIYEGESELLGLAFFRSLVRHHAARFFQPMQQALQAAGLPAGRLGNPAHAWALRGTLGPYAKWWLARQVSVWRPPRLPELPLGLRPHARFAAEQLPRVSLQISRLVRRHQHDLAARQCRMSEMAARIRALVVMLCTSLYASRSEDHVVVAAADVICSDLRRGLGRGCPTDRELRAAARLGEMIAEGGYRSFVDEASGEILMRY